MIGETKLPKTKQDLLRSIQSIPRMDFEVIEAGSIKDKSSVIKSLDRRLSKAPVSIILIQEK
jgi:DNA helicase HerA-like ATPase